MTTPADPSPAARRRAARRAENRAEILDAAERVFAGDGLQAGSVRKIGAESGFSAAAIYLFFDNKQELLVETLARRGHELVTAIEAAVQSGADPRDSLHRVIDVTVDYFEAHPAFARIVHQLRGAGPALSEFGRDASPLFDHVTNLLAELVRTGQAAGQLRTGDPHALAHLYEVLLHEHVVLAAAAAAAAAGPSRSLTRPELHGFIDGALRQATR